MKLAIRIFALLVVVAGGAAAATSSTFVSHQSATASQPAPFPCGPSGTPCPVPPTPPSN